jgi:stage III sporulation protein SpoIIIAA
MLEPLVEKNNATPSREVQAMLPLDDIRVTDDLGKLLEILPPRIREALDRLKPYDDLIEVVLDLGRQPEARFSKRFTFLSEDYVSEDDIAYVVSRVGEFGKDNRAGIARTLHRISAIRNRSGKIIGLTCRVGRAVFGTISVIRDVVESGKSILLLGRPGVGKTTMLREVARVLNDELNKRVVIVDTSNEIAGDGDIPHPGIGRARRMQVQSYETQHKVMIEAVENHMPEVVVVDEIGTEAEAYAARTIAERGVQLIATAHGNTLENLLLNPTLSDLVGGIQAVTLSDEEARRRGTQKTVLERKAPPTFDVVIEIQEIDRFVIHDNIPKVIDLMLRNIPPQPEVRIREHGEVKIVQESNLPQLTQFENEREEEEEPSSPKEEFDFRTNKVINIFPYAVSRNRLEKAIANLKVSANVVRNWNEADVVLTLKAQERRNYKKLRELEKRNIRTYGIKSNTINQIQNFLRTVFHLPSVDVEELAVREAEEASLDILRNPDKICELSPQNPYLRRLQHQVIEKYNLKSRSVGKEPNRRVTVYAK